MTPTRPSGPAVNEAAEKLRSAIEKHMKLRSIPMDDYRTIEELLDEALVTERRNTVERIRARLNERDAYRRSSVDLAAILDEVAS